METTRVEDLQQDGLAMSAARALALANEAALAHGTEPAESLVSISEESPAVGRVWRIHDGPRDSVGRRGGDLIVLVDDRGQTVQRIIRGR